MPQDTFIITLPPRQLPALQLWRVTPAHLAYRVGPGPHLFRADHTAPRGGLMVVDDREFDGLGSTGPLCQEILRECQARNFSGAVLDFENRLPPLEQIAGTLNEQFARRGWNLFVTERYASKAPQARVMIPSALSGGSLQRRLEEALERFGESRVVLALEKRAEDFRLPSPTGSGTALSEQELTGLMDRLRPSVFFSGELCARYFTYMSRENGAHFVLFDDGDTLRRKLDVARQLNIHTFLAPWAEVSAYAARLGIQRKPEPSRQGRR
ncbi:MAG: hypothetical protein HFF38_06325 [Lawsonibacter sp.]|jgi:hypothetical protein|nr:hypothetical protein [Lawsonibacter sp.]